MMLIDAKSVTEAVGGVPAPGGEPLADTGAIASVTVKDQRATIVLQVPSTADVSLWDPVGRAVREAAERIPGIASASVVMTAERTPDGRELGPTRAAASRTPPAGRGQTRARLAGLAEVRHVIAIASGKGGVGKSTTAVNLAVSLKALGLAVGFMDADVHGPSGPKLFGLRGQPRIVAGKTIAPLERYGCKVMSIGFLVEAEKAMIWRGPMVSSAITQMLRDVAWGVLDVLVVDMPPGTGDAQLTLAQNVALDGAVIVSTPQDLALIDARRGIAMFRDVNVPILGILENMSYFVCDQCGKQHHIFAHGGAESEARRLGVPFLGAVPLDLAVRERSDAGVPIAVADPDGDVAQRYRRIAEDIARTVVAR